MKITDDMRAWRELSDDAIAKVMGVPTMLTHEEQKMLFYYASQCAEGGAVLIDLGCYLGGSTARIALGAGLNGQPYQLHAYDRFIFDEQTRNKYIKNPKFLKLSGTGIVSTYLKDFLPHIILHEGDLLSQNWDGRSIDMLFIDIDKSISSADHVSKTFFPSLINGKSILVSQDFQFIRQPWCAVQMELFADRFEYIGHCNSNSVVFRAIAPISAKDCEERKLSDLSETEFIYLLNQAISRFQNTTIATHLEAMRNDIKRVGMWRSAIEHKRKLSDLLF